ncbi:6-phosphogluconolactonase [Pricia antarctica]|uniref:6-phosphogluconolactonase n=1 Tax=Pricia antarctica TaxID=641691 RepID=A0A1G7J0P3_9FLAO|nr:lactonase family protein [Pricia antarctica]SDF18426.1 6-phosphogluconolactonase [Pricia antarctica]
MKLIYYKYNAIGPYKFLLFFILILALGCRIEPEKNETQLKNQNEQNTNIELLIGTSTSGNSKGIYKLDFDRKTGTLSNKSLLVESQNPGYLYLSKDRHKVYSSNSTKPGSVSVYEWNDTRSHLKVIGQHSSEGDGACYIELNPSETLLAAANFGSGSIVVYPLDKDGNVAGFPRSVKHTGSGPHPNQKSAHAHCVKFSESGEYLYAVDLGMDEIVAYNITADKRLLGQSQTVLKLDAGDGPRHLIFHQSKKMAFVINELSSTVISVKINPATGQFERIDKQSTLPVDFKGENKCADIHLSSNGKFLYASNRGHNSIAIFSVSEQGKMELLANEPVQGDWPRNFVLSPDNEFLLVANKKSNNISVFSVDQKTGLLEYTGNQIVLSQPTCLKF